jgi:hypothetical protein
MVVSFKNGYVKMTISIHSQYENVHRSAELVNSQEDLPHGMTASQIDLMKERFETMVPNLASKYTTNSNQNLFKDSLPKGAAWDPRNKTAQSYTQGYGPSDSGGGKTLTTVQTPYQPEFASPDRQNYPVHRILANRYWRLFYKLDPVIGNCIEMMSDLPWSNFELTGDGVEGEIRQAYEYMCRETQVLAMLPYFVREFMVVGECCPHAYFDNSKGVFTHIAMHNPDQLEVIDAPFIKMDPIIEFIPDDRLRNILTSNAPSLREVRNRMPPELLSRLQSRQNIPLSPINATFIPRKLHPYDTRGTSILSRLWRVLMYEDSVFNASIQTARRHAMPLKIAKLGNAQTGWIPPPEQEKRLLELLAQAELDVNAWIVYHYGVTFETVGTSDRLMGIKSEYETIERIKLIALGISKSFLSGETSYASSATGLQVFLQRLKALRMYFEQKWLYPKFLRPVAEINGWIKPKPAEVAHRFRVKRSAAELEEQNAYIIPKIVWDKSLDPQVNMELINAMSALEGIGVHFSKTSKMASIGYSFEEEVKKSHRENEYEKTYLPSLPEEAPQEGGAPPMGGGGSGKPIKPPGDKDLGKEPGAPGTPPVGAPGTSPTGAPPPPGAPPPSGAPPPPKASAEGADPETAKDKSVQKLSIDKPSKSSFESLKSEIWIDDKYGNWSAEEISDLVDLITTLDTESAFWDQLGTVKSFKKALLDHDMDSAWLSMVDYLGDFDYPTSDIESLREILEAEHILDSNESVDNLKKIENGISDNMSDLEFANAVAGLIKDDSGKIVATDTFFTGNG